MDGMRPDPDKLLEKVMEEEKNFGKGKLKIFFGYAAGVGKTYAMLKSAHDTLAGGADIIIGYIEPHARPETEALTAGLERLPLLNVSYNNIVLKEFNIDAALKRRPEIILVDELAHTNAEGCRHKKRYQDIEELLNAGIDVYTTVNVQHLESLNDMIAGITGVIVKERIPDFVFDKAEQVELVDIEPEELLTRLKMGKIYKENQADRAMSNFFSVEHLVSLREIALRRMADRVNYIQEKKAFVSSEGQGASNEHLLICLSSSPSNEKVIRQAARMAGAFHGKFTAVYVETPEFGSMSRENRDRLKQNTRLAEQMGARAVTLYGSDISMQIAEYARLSRVTKIVLGRSYTKRRIFSVKETFADKLVRLSPQLEVFLIPDSYDKKYVKGRKKTGTEYTKEGWTQDVVLSMLLLIVATAGACFFDYLKFEESNLIMIYLLSMLIESLVTKYRLTNILYSILCVFTFNFFYTIPRGTFKVNDPAYLITFAVMVVVALIESSLTGKVKSYARQAAKRAYRTEILLESSRKFQQAAGKEEIGKRLCEQLSRLLERNVYFFPGNPEECGEPVSVIVHEDRKGFLNREEKAVAQWTYKNSKHAGFSTTTLPGGKFLYLAVRNGEKVFAVTGIDMEGHEMSNFDEGIMSAMLNECAVALEKNELIIARKESELKLSREQLRANLLRSISHDLRTPLTSISGNASVLMTDEKKISPEQKKKLYTDIYDDSMWLINLVENLLSVTRIENGSMELRLQPELLEDIISEGIKNVGRRSEEHEIIFENPDDLVVAKIDARLVMQVIINLVDNAVKYTPKGSEIRISTSCRNGWIYVEVADNGKGIPDEQKKRLFDMFYTVNNELGDSRRGLGLGLPLCKSIIEAHGGKIEVRDNFPQGTIFCFTLQAEEVKMP